MGRSEHFSLLAREKAWSDELTATLWTPILAWTNPTLWNYSSWSTSLKNGAFLVVKGRVHVLYPTIPLQLLKYSCTIQVYWGKHNVRGMDSWDPLKSKAVGITGWKICAQVILDATLGFLFFKLKMEQSLTSNIQSPAFAQRDLSLDHKD